MKDTRTVLWFAGAVALAALLAHNPRQISWGIFITCVVGWAIGDLIWTLTKRAWITRRIKKAAAGEIPGRCRCSDQGLD